ncbi:MAG: DDE-type integrase/transposase/recombinase [Candidatus Uhrbacteria bacterium]|nr:DDE-type integrase/transposase/recombinase [Candidatus Uhrbacteria bacterium]
MAYMAYTKNPHMPTVRRDAVKLVKYRGWSTRKVARHLGYTHSAIVKWCKKDPTGGWHEIPTLSSKPKRSPHALSRELVNAIIKKRVGRRRCGQVIHRELLADGIAVSLCSVQRTLKRCHLLKERSPWKRPHDATERPLAAYPGALVQADTVHFVLPDGSRLYVYTLVDLYSRWAYAEVSLKLRAYKSAHFLARAQKKAPFTFVMIQTDHGPEFSTRFTRILLRMKIAHRHSRVRQCNDNAHVERFNRTLQDECLAGVVRSLSAFKKAISGYLPYYINDRMHMGIDFKTPAQMLALVPRS